MSQKKQNKKDSVFNGGCWFCCKKTKNMQFSCEFDTMVHESCIRKTLIKNRKHPEAKIMARELEIKIA